MRIPRVSEVDPDNGFLCFSVHWRENPSNPDPEMPGLKQTAWTYLSCKSDEECLCGSGKLYADCCQLQTIWFPICPNPGLSGYSLLRPQEVTFSPVEGRKIRNQLMEDERLFCVDDSDESSFWIFWGDPSYQERRLGVYCFGDIELIRNQKLYVTTMSDVRMQALLQILREVGGIELGETPIKYDTVEAEDKSVYKRPTSRKSGSRGGKKK